MCGSCNHVISPYTQVVLTQVFISFEQVLRLFLVFPCIIRKTPTI